MKATNKLFTLHTVPASIWTLKDICILLSLIIFTTIFSYIGLRILLGDTKYAFNLARCMGSILIMLIPILYGKTSYGYNLNALGLTRSNNSLLMLITLGITFALSYHFTVRYVLFEMKFTSPQNANLFYRFISPLLSLGGFASAVLAPISEEILIRGVVYNYLRSLLGNIIGLIVQALIFSMLHYGKTYSSAYFLIDPFLIGIILGTLYMITNSLLPSIICHSIINYLGLMTTS